MKEMDLFLPIKAYFEEMGFVVDGEVKDCDMLCVHEEQMIAVELKNELNFKLFMQGAKRQKMFDLVYIAVWMPKVYGTKAFRDKMYLLNRLGLGLILVSKRSKKVTVHTEPLIHEVKEYQQRNKKNRQMMVNEMKKRRLKINTGGVTGTEILTVYRENSLIVLDTLIREGAMRSKDIKLMTGLANSYAIVYQNHYNWFVREGKGIYNVNDIGRKAFNSYQDVIRKLREQLNGEEE